MLEIRNWFRKVDVDPFKRFEGRAEDYSRFRPRYSFDTIEFLMKQKVLSPGDVIADIGSGTGLFSELLLENGNRVYGVEPNEEMRKVAQENLSHYEGFRSTAGTAEDTRLEHQSVDLIVSAEAFHWFDLEKTKCEFRRILRPGGKVVLLWNLRRKESPFEQAFEKFFRRYGVGYKKLQRWSNSRGVIDSWFGTSSVRTQTFENSQQLDLESLRGRVQSVSYMPNERHHSYLKMMNEVSEIYYEFEQEGCVELRYVTKIYYGGMA